MLEDKPYQTSRYCPDDDHPGKTLVMVAAHLPSLDASYQGTDDGDPVISEVDEQGSSGAEMEGDEKGKSALRLLIDSPVEELG